MQTSEQGIAFIERHEGVVLKAYRDPVGIWTIGAGLTAASGVVTPEAGMVLAAEEASALTRKALAANYDPAVSAALPGVTQQVHDGAASFHWNTGAIGRASWVTALRAGKTWSEIERRLKLWNKGGGKVLPGLTRRRAEEFALIRYGDYGAGANRAPASGQARFVFSVSAEEITAIRKGFADLGYAPGNKTGGVDKAAVLLFQRDHDLTVDGLIGKATLSTLQRMLDARRTAATATVSTGGTLSGAGISLSPDMPLPAWADAAIWSLLLVALGWSLWRAWHYRDAIAARLQGRVPTLAAKLRSL